MFHSIILNNGEKEFVYDSIKPNSKGIIRVNSHKYIASDSFIYNSAEDKLQYLYSSLDLSNDPLSSPLLQLIKNVLIDMTDAGQIVFEYQEYMQSEASIKTYWDYVYRSNRYPEAIKTLKTYEDVKTFIFDKNSWLFGNITEAEKRVETYFRDGTIKPFEFKYEISCKEIINSNTNLPYSGKLGDFRKYSNDGFDDNLIFVEDLEDDVISYDICKAFDNFLNQHLVYIPKLNIHVFTSNFNSILEKYRKENSYERYNILTELTYRIENNILKSNFRYEKYHTDLIEEQGFLLLFWHTALFSKEYPYIIWLTDNQQWMTEVLKEFNKTDINKLSLKEFKQLVQKYENTPYIYKMKIDVKKI